MLTKFSVNLRKVLVRYSELKNIRRKKNLIAKVSLSDHQKQEIKDFFKQNYGRKIRTDWHRLYQSYTGAYHKDYFPEILLSTELEPKLNPYREAEFLGDKNFLPILFSGIDGLRVPKTYLSSVKGVVRDNNGSVLRTENAVEIIKDLGQCVIKRTVDTSSGRDVQVCDIDNGIDRKTEMPISHILKNFGNDFVVQERIVQHESLSLLNPTSVNTFRVMTYILDGQIFVCPIALRLGRSNSDRDNIHYGGIVIGVNDDGTLKDKAFSEFGNSYKEHPDTKVSFDNYAVPIIEKSKSLHISDIAKQMHSRIPWLGILSFDLTIDSSGVVVVLEVNTTGQSAWFCQMVNGMPLFGENTSRILKLIKK